MKRFGQGLMWLGFAVGATVGGMVLAHVGIPGASWLVNVGLAKLGLAAGIGLMGGGAVVQRIAARRETSRITAGARDGSA